MERGERSRMNNEYKILYLRNLSSIRPKEQQQQQQQKTPIKYISCTAVCMYISNIAKRNDRI